MRREQVLVQVGFLTRKAEAEPFREDLVMAVAEGAVGDVAADDLAHGRVGIAAGKEIAQRGEEDEAAEVGRDALQAFSATERPPVLPQVPVMR